MPQHTSTVHIDATTGQAFELTWPDGSTLRLRWDAGAQAVKLVAERIDRNGAELLASSLVIRPQTGNSVLLNAEV